MRRIANYANLSEIKRGDHAVSPCRVEAFVRKPIDRPLIRLLLIMLSTERARA